MLGEVELVNQTDSTVVAVTLHVTYKDNQIRVCCQKYLFIA